ncbi:MAG: hypothetical protein RL591_1116 [Planctomycetota bacterium]|jgi:hypothetical protein
MLLPRIRRPLALVYLFVGFTILGFLVAPIAWLPSLLFSSVHEYAEFVANFYRAPLGLSDPTSNFSGAQVALFTVPVLIWAGLAVAFLAPITGKLQTTTEPRSLLPSVIAAVIIGILMFGSIGSAAYELLCALEAMTKDEFERKSSETRRMMTFVMLASWAVGGTCCALLFRRLGSTRDLTALDRMLRVLFAGSVLELTLGLPLFFIIRKKSACECALASFWSLVLGIAALLWICGPAVLLLLTRDARRAWMRSACPNCGYPRRTSATCCSECGASFPG